MAVEQVVFSPNELHHWSQLVPHPARQAILALDEAALVEQFGLRLQDGPRDDGLGPTRVAGIPLPSGRRVLLVLHRYAPQAGCEIVADYEDVLDPEPVSELLKVLRLEPSVVVWRPPPDWPERPRRGA